MSMIPSFIAAATTKATVAAVPTLDGIEIARCDLCDYLNLLTDEHTVRELIQLVEAEVVATEKLFMVTPQSHRAGVFNWPGRLAELQNRLTAKKTEALASKVLAGWSATVRRQLGWVNGRQARLTKTKTAARYAARLYTMVTAYNNGVLPPEPAK